MRRRRIGVLADDLTGAGDVGLAFHTAGFKVEIGVLSGGGAFPKKPSRHADVWVLDTESRHLPSLAAARLVTKAVETLRKWKAVFYYKKIDSTLRGNLSSEVGAFLHALRLDRRERCAFVPAFPKMGRLTLQGTLFVDGVPLQRTAFGRDPRHPVKSGFVLQGFREGFRPVLWVPDITGQRDMRRAADRVVKGESVCPFAAVGSAGLAEELAKLLNGSTARIHHLPPSRPSIQRRVLVVAGSAHRKTREQLEQLRGSKAASSAVVLSAPSERSRPSKVIAGLAACAYRFMHKEGFHRVVATGGETAYALCRRWEKHRWKIVKPVARGIPLCRSAEKKPLWLALKPGGFGGKDALMKAVHKLQEVK